MKIEGVSSKFKQISDIFSQFSEDNKDKLLETAENLLKVQTASSVSQDEEKKET